MGVMRARAGLQTAWVRRRTSPFLEMPNLVHLSLVGTMLCYLPPRGSVSAGCDTAYDGWVREGQTLGCYGKTACAGAPSQSRCGETRTLASVLLGLLRLHLYASIAMPHSHSLRFAHGFTAHRGVLYP